MPTPEQIIKREIKAEVERMGGFWSCVQGGMGSKPGDPDIVACFNGRYVAIEAKTPEGRLSDVQKHRRDQIERAGGLYLVVRSKDGFLDALRDNGIYPVKGGDNGP